LARLLEPLSDQERSEIYLAILIAHTAPQTHPIYNEPWLIALADKVMLYDVPQRASRSVAEWERTKDYVHKAIFDYTYVMQKCVDRARNGLR